MQKGVLISLLFLFFIADIAIPNQAELHLPDLSEESKMSDFLAYAALNNPGLKSVHGKWLSTLFEATYQGALPDPVVSYGHYFEEIETRVGPQKHKFSISQKVPWFGKRRLRKNIYLQKADFVKKELDEKKSILFRDVRKAVYDYVYITRAIRELEENLRIVTTLSSSIKGRYTVGNSSHASFSSVQIEAEILRNRFLSIQALKQPYMAKLNSLLNRNIDQDIPVISLPHTDYYKHIVMSLNRNGLEKNSAISKMDAIVKEEEFVLEYVRKDDFPDFTFGLAYIQTDEAGVDGISDNGKDPVIGSISFNLPIWRGKSAARRISAVNALLHAKEGKLNKARALEADYEMALYRFSDASRKMDLYKKSLIPKTQEALSVLLKGFSAGTANYKELLNTQKKLLNFSLEYEKALRDYRINYAELIFITNRDEVDKDEH